MVSEKEFMDAMEDLAKAEAEIERLTRERDALDDAMEWIRTYDPEWVDKAREKFGLTGKDG